MKVKKLLQDTPPPLPLIPAFADNPGPDLTADWDLHQTVSGSGSWATNKSPVLIAGKKFKSTSWETPAVYLDTDRMVVFERCDFWHRGSGLANWLNSSTYKRGARVRLVNCRFFELPSRETDSPELTKKAPGKAVKLVYLNHFEMENCEVYGSSGVLVDRAEDPQGIATVRVRCNKWRGVNGNYRDVVPGKRKESSAGASLIQVMKLYRLRHSEIGWNDFYSVPGRHGIEDIINVYNAGGYYKGSWRQALSSPNSDPLLIHHNFLRGAHPYPVNDSSSSGSSIICDGNGRENNSQVEGEPHMWPHLVYAFANYCLDSNNAGTNIASGWGNKFWDNRLLSAGMLPAGTPYPEYHTDGEGKKVVWRKYEQEQPFHYNASAMAIFDFVKRGAAYTENTPKEMMATNSMQGQRVGWRKWKSNSTYNGKMYTDRLDLTENEFARQIVHTVHETDGPITLVDLDFAYHQWLVKVQLVGNRIGVVEGK